MSPSTITPAGIFGVTSGYFSSVGTLPCGAVSFCGGIYLLYKIYYETKALGVSSNNGATHGPFGSLCATVVGGPTLGGAIVLCIRVQSLFYDGSHLFLVHIWFTLYSHICNLMKTTFSIRPLYTFITLSTIV
jgi:hypothetical protein